MNKYLQHEVESNQWHYEGLRFQEKETLLPVGRRFRKHYKGTELCTDR